MEQLVKKCRVCGEVLVLNSNWTDGLKKKNYYLCRKCKSKKGKDWNSSNKEAVKRNQKNWIEKKLEQNPEYYKESHQKHKTLRNKQSRLYRRLNKEKVRKMQEKWRLENPNYSKEYCRSNRGKVNANTSKRRAKKLQRTPKWADLDAIKRFYENCPAGYEVDHIIPLQGKNISGFHVLENLQYLTKSENCRKGNRYV